MIIMGVDFHPEFQQTTSVDTATGEFQAKGLAHPEEAAKFYRALAVAGQRVRVGMEAGGHARWLERLLAELQFELWIGPSAETACTILLFAQRSFEYFLASRMNCGILCNVTNWGLRLGLTSDMRLYDNCTMTLGIVDFWVLSVFYNL